MRSLRQSRLRRARKSEDTNPMDGMANLADVMLVFACGILIALIAAWNLDVSDQGNIPSEIESLGESGQEVEMDKDQLKEMGTVYYNPETGKYYLLDQGSE